MIERGRITETEKANRISLISTSLNFNDLSDADLIIEAAFEDLELKKEIFSKLNEIAKSGAILATNTSYMDITQIAAVTQRAEDIIGLHFFVPANVINQVFWFFY